MGGASCPACQSLEKAVPPEEAPKQRTSHKLASTRTSSKASGSISKNLSASPRVSSQSPRPSFSSLRVSGSSPRAGSSPRVGSSARVSAASLKGSGTSPRLSGSSPRVSSSSARVSGSSPRASGTSQRTSGHKKTGGRTSTTSGQGSPAQTGGREHEGQRRASLVVKDGGFRLGDFMASNPGKILDFYDIEKKVLGEGGFGSVSRGKDKRTGKFFAVKKVRIAKKDEEKKLREEIAIMRMLDHPHIVRLVESFEDRKTVYLCMDLCVGGELFERLAAAGAVPEKAAATCVRQMLLAVNYLHQNLIIHRDLKPENWLLETQEEVGKAPLKLIDFGISTRYTIGIPCRTKTGTPAYAAPEVLAGRYNQKVDIWALGVITYIMLCGGLPFPGKNAEQILAKVREAKVELNGSAWRKVSPEAKSLVRLLLQKDYTTRPSAAQALELDWVKAAIDKDVKDAAPTMLEVRYLKSFSKMHKLKRAALTVIATQLPGHKIESLQALFKKMDVNHDGTVSMRELSQALVESGVDVPKDLERLLEEVDTDGSGVMDYTEFLAATMDKQLYHQESVVWQAFKKFDMDNNGHICKEDLAKILGEEEVQGSMFLEGGGVNEVFDKVDTNADGVIDFDEFMAMMRATESMSTQAFLRDDQMSGDEGVLGCKSIGIAQGW